MQSWTGDFKLYMQGCQSVLWQFCDRLQTVEDLHAAQKNNTVSKLKTGCDN